MFQFGTRKPEAAFAAASGAGRHAQTPRFPAFTTDIRIVVAMIDMRYQARHARVVAKRRSRIHVASTARTTGLVSLVAAGAILAVGATSGFMTSTKTSADNNVIAGTVSLAKSASTSCSVSAGVPDGSVNNCTFTATYGGSADAYLAVDLLIETQAGSGGTKLYNPTDSANDLQVTITSTSPAVTYTVPTASATCPGAAPALSSCYELDNELVSASALGIGESRAFTIATNIPTTSTTGYQGGAAQILVTAHAVQSANNTVACSGVAPSVSPATAGKPCTPTGSFTWS